MTRLQPGEDAPNFVWHDIDGNEIALRDYRNQHLLMLFFRFAACPFCNLHMHRLLEMYPELQARGLNVVAFFQSPYALIARHVGKQNPPFPILADPDMKVYNLYRVEKSLLAPLKALRRAPSALQAMARGYLPTEIDGDTSLMPADFLIGPNQKIRVAYYGKDVGDHLPLERVASIARHLRPPNGDDTPP